MGNKIAVTDNGVHKIGKKLFLTNENLVHRKVKKTFLTKNGVHRLAFSSGTVWEKYDCQYAPRYEETPHGQRTAWQGFDWSPHEFYSTYVFSEEDGISMIGEVEADFNNIVGTYLEEAISDNEEGVWVVTEIYYTDNGFPYYRYKTVLAYERIDGWKATDYIGNIEVEDGELPEEGTLIEGSPTGEYCVLEVDHSKYYYIRGD